MPGTSWGSWKGGFPIPSWGSDQGRGKGECSSSRHLCAPFVLIISTQGSPASWLNPGDPLKGLGFGPNAQPCPAPPRPGPLLQASFCLERPHLLPSFFTGPEFSEPLHQFAAHSPGKPGTQLPIAQMEETEARMSPRSPYRLWGCLYVIYKLPRSLGVTSHPSQFVADAARPWRKWDQARSRVSSTEVSPEMNRGGA